LKILTICWYPVNTWTASRPSAIGTTSHGIGVPTTIPAASAIAPRSAPMFTTLATTTSATAG
jgi:hypothetical protein